MRAWLELRRLPRRLWVLAAATLINRMGTMALPFLSLYVTRGMGLPPATAGQLWALYGATALCAGPLAGRLADRWGSTALWAGAFAVGLVSTAMFWFMPRTSAPKVPAAASPVLAA